jgi:deoxyribonuclease V
LHPWRLSLAGALRIQASLAGRVQLEPLAAKPRWVAGLDAAFSADGAWCLGGVVLWDLVERRVAECRTARRALWFPYVPGLLSFREAPALLAALRRVECRPDVLMCDGQGLAHPRRFGLACHLGLLTRIPSLGCAKSRLIGEDRTPGWGAGSREPLKVGEERLGTILRTRDGVRPVYVSAGYRLTLEDACELVLRCVEGSRIPEPTRLADRLVAAFKRELASQG